MKKSMRERMLAGEPYLPLDPELTRMRERAQRVVHAMNTTIPDADRRRELVQKLFGSFGENSEVMAPFYCDYGSYISAGEGVFINYGCVILDCNRVRLGDRVLLGPHVQIYTATHPLDPDERAKGWESALPIEIGDDVWIGGAAVICPGIEIGEGSTIGAGSVVTRSIPPRVFAAGNPCRVIRNLAA